jgi:hydrogenase maturation protease
LGNPILGDDAVGWRIAETVRERLGESTPEIEVDCASLGGLALMERLEGYQRALLVDAIHTGKAPPGTLHQLSLEDLPSRYANSAHDVSFKQSIEMGRSLGVSLPGEIRILAVEIEEQWELKEGLSAEVEEGMKKAVEILMEFFTA